MTPRHYILTVAAVAFLLSGCQSSAVPSSSINSRSQPSIVQANSIFILRERVFASKPTLSGSVVSGSGSFATALSKGATETLVSDLYEGSKVVATAKKTVHGPADAFSVTAKYTCKGRTDSKFHTVASGTGLFRQGATSDTVTLACN
jgi:hypothetical protein